MRLRCEQCAFGEYPGVEQSAGFQGGLQSCAGVARQVGSEIDELPQWCPDRLGADRRIPGVGRRRRLVLASFQTRAFGLQLGLLD